MPIPQARLLAALATVVVLVGCGGDSGEQMADSRRSAQQSYGDAEKDFAARQYAAAEPKYAAALAAGGLNGDQYSDAIVKQAVCLAAAKKYPEATALLDKLEPGAINLDQILAARSFLLKKQGKAAESRAALTKAKRLNPRIQEFKG